MSSGYSPKSLALISKVVGEEVLGLCSLELEQMTPQIASPSSELMG